MLHDDVTPEEREQFERLFALGGRYPLEERNGLHWVSDAAAAAYRRAYAFEDAVNENADARKREREAAASQQNIIEDLKAEKAELEDRVRQMRQMERRRAEQEKKKR